MSTDVVAMEQVGFTKRFPTSASPSSAVWDTTNCGATPTNNGSCARIQMRNMYGTQDLSRAYFYLEVLTPGTGDTVSVRAQDTAAAEGGLLGTHGTEVANGLWRYGLVERTTPTTTHLNSRYWVFTGTNTGPWTFRFTGQVIAKRQTPIIRLSNRNALPNTATAPNTYSLGTSASAVTLNGSMDVTADGKYAVFSSNDTNLASNSTNGTNTYRVTVATGAVTSATEGASGGNPDAVNPSVSSDGNWVAFESGGCKFQSGNIPNSDKSVYQIWVRDVLGGTTFMVSHDSTDVLKYGNANSSYARISADGKSVTFLSKATNLLSGTFPGTSGNVYLYRATINQSAHTASVSHVGSSWVVASNPDISSDGKYIVMDTAATGLDGKDTNTNQDVYIYDTTASDAVSLLSLKSTNTHFGSTSSCSMPTISTDGTTVAFLCSTASSGDHLVTAPSWVDNKLHVYKRSTTTSAAGAATIQLVDKTAAGTAPAGAAVQQTGVALNGDGSLVGYISTATDILRTSGCTPSCQSTSSVAQAYVYDLPR